jgi:hypothetical protein
MVGVEVTDPLEGVTDVKKSMLFDRSWNVVDLWLGLVYWIEKTYWCSWLAKSFWRWDFDTQYVYTFLTFRISKIPSSRFLRSQFLVLELIFLSLASSISPR